MSSVFSEWVEEVGGHLGPPPRRLGTTVAKTAFSTPKPAWCVAPDPMRIFFKEKSRLLKTGEVTLGIIVQANAAAYSRGPYTHPADILFPADPRAEPTATELADVRDRLLSLDPDRVPEDLRPFASALTDERARAFGAAVPERLTAGTPLALTSTLLYRAMLPGGTLSRTLVPLLVAPQSPRVSLVVPKSYWPQGMYDWWLDGLG